MKNYKSNVISRRKMLKSTAALSAAASASIILGCPAVHANEAPTFGIWEPPSIWVVNQKRGCLKILASK